MNGNASQKGHARAVSRYALPSCVVVSLAVICYLLARAEVTELSDGSIVYKSRLYSPAASAETTNQNAAVIRELAALKEQYQIEVQIRKQKDSELQSLSNQYATALYLADQKAVVSRPRNTTATRVTAPPAQAPQRASASTPAITARHHAAAAEAYALDYFSFKSDLAKNSASITASINIKETKELPNWNRYGSKGEANITYLTSQGGFKTVSRSFEVYTEEKDGRAQGVDITVGF